MGKIKKIQQHNIDIYPLTHEDAVFDNDGVSIGEKINQLDVNKADKSDLDNLQTEINGLENDKADQSYVDEKLEVVDALTLNGYSIWVGTTEELEAITEKDPNTLYFEIGDNTGEEVVQVDIVDGITLECPSNTELTVKGIDKILVGEFAANIRKVRQPEPYKGKGIRYKGEHVRRKEGKKASK